MNTAYPQHIPLPHRLLGHYVRDARLAANLRQTDVAEKMQWSVSKICRLEQGHTGKLYDRDLELLASILGLGREKTDVLIDLARQVAQKSWWNRCGHLIPAGFNVYISLENEACRLEIFRPDIVSGLFQTPDYARALDDIYFPDESEEGRAGRVQVRLQRQAILTTKLRQVTVDAVFHESALRTVVGDAATMEGEMRHLADVSTLPNVRLRILPYSAGFPTGAQVGPFTVLDFAPEPRGVSATPTIVYTESSLAGDMYLEDDIDVRAHRRAAAVIRAAAYDETTSRQMFRHMAREFR